MGKVAAGAQVAQLTEGTALLEEPVKGAGAVAQEVTQVAQQALAVLEGCGAVAAVAAVLLQT